MLITFTRKFTVFFWSIFFITTFPLVIFATFYVKGILLESEDKKIEFMVNVLKPTLALNLSFGQNNEVRKILQTILEEKNIVRVDLISKNFQESLTKNGNHIDELLLYKTKIVDPFDDKLVSTIKIYHSTEYLVKLYNKIITILGFILLFALGVFLLFYVFMKKEFNALTYIAETFQNYSTTGKMDGIITNSKTKEITTITKTANEMIQSISSYFNELQSLNNELESKVEEKVKALQVQEGMLIHQSRQAAMGEMIESIAHQWKQPLNIIGIASANLEMEHDLGIQNAQNFKSKISIITDNITYMSNTIDDFRDFLNPDRTLDHFNPIHTIEEVHKIFAAQLRNNKIKITIKPLKPIQFYGVENEFKQVVFIILNNAQDAIKSQQKNGTIENGKIDIILTQKNRQGIISFCDNGGGIAEEHMHSIFNPYFTTKFASSGTGIGLYIAKNIIVSRMLGKIKTFNTASGCCFEVTQHKDIKEQM